MGFWVLTGVLALHLSNGSIDYRTVKLDVCYNMEWVFAAENEDPDTRLPDQFDVGDNYIIGATCIAPPEVEEEGAE